MEISDILWVLNQIEVYFTEHPTLLSLLSIPVSVGIFLSKQHLDKTKDKKELHDRICRFCATIISDIQAIRLTLDNPRYKKRVDKNKNLEYTHLVIFTNIYNGLLHTGLIIYFSTQLQIDLDNLYAKIHFRNDLLKERISAFTNMILNPNDKLKEIHDQYEELITQIENELKSELIVVEDKLVSESEEFQN